MVKNKKKKTKKRVKMIEPEKVAKQQHKEKKRKMEDVASHLIAGSYNNNTRYFIQIESRKKNENTKKNSKK